jgi:hypothetical protein
LLTLFLGGVPWGVAGCDSSKEVPLLLVTGTVQVEGQPLKLGWVTFYPDAGAGNHLLWTPVAQINEDGAYEVTTNGKAGAPAGWYKVVVAAAKDPLPARPPPPREGKPWRPRWLHHEKYTRPDTTDLKIEVVKEPPPRHYDLRLTR